MLQMRGRRWSLGSAVVVFFAQGEEFGYEVYPDGIEMKWYLTVKEAREACEKNAFPEDMDTQSQGCLMTAVSTVRREREHGGHRRTDRHMTHKGSR